MSRVMKMDNSGAASSRCRKRSVRPSCNSTGISGSIGGRIASSANLTVSNGVDASMTTCTASNTLREVVTDTVRCTPQSEGAVMVPYGLAPQVYARTTSRHHAQLSLAKTVVDIVSAMYVELHDTTVVFTGHVKEQSILDRLEEVAKGVEGATAVDASKVTIE
jgi:osmotically-inducible protein OsmY